jgi:hypothetical protein
MNSDYIMRLIKHELLTFSYNFLKLFQGRTDHIKTSKFDHIKDLGEKNDHIKDMESLEE